MAITLEELRKRASEENTEANTGNQRQVMTLDELRQKAGTTAPQTKTAEANASAVSVNKAVTPTAENTEKEGNLWKLGGAFLESGIQGIGNAFSNLANTADTLKSYTAVPGSVYNEIQDTFYDVNKAGEVAEIVKRNQELYGKGSEYQQNIQEDIKGRNEKQAQKLADIQDKYKDVKYADLAITAGSGIGNLAPSMVVGGLTGGAGTAAFGANVFGGAMGEALNNGATMEQATGYALADAAMETGIEMLFGGVPFLNKGVAKVEELSAKYLKTAAGQVLANRLMDITGEGIEEVASSIIEPFLKRAFYDKDAEFATLSDMAAAFGGGALVSAILGVANFGGNVQEYRDIKNRIAENKKVATNDETAVDSENVADIQQSRDVQRAAENLQTVQQLNANGIDTGNAVQELTEKITGEKPQPAADVKIVERENARVAAIEEAYRQGNATAEDVQKVRYTANENIRQSENKAVVTQKFGDEEISRIEELVNTKGYRVVYEADESDNAPNGYIKDGVIYINTAGNSPYFNVAVHEVLHGLRGNTAKWDKLEKAVFQLIGSDGAMTDFADNVVAKYTENTDSVYYKSLLTDGVLDQTKVNEEVVANFVEEYLPKIAKSDAQLMEAIKKDRSLIDGLLDIIRGIKNNLAIKFAKSERAMLDEAERNLVNLLRAENKGVSNNESNIRFSKKGGFIEQLIQARNGGLFRESHLMVSAKTPKLYEKFGLDTELPMLVTKKHALDITTPEDGIHDEFHGITDKQLKAAIKDISDPALIFESLSHPGRLVVVTSIVDDKKRPIILAIEPNAKGYVCTVENKSEERDTNLIASMYGRNNFMGFFVNNITNDNLLYHSKEKSRLLSNIPGVQFPSNIPRVDFNKNIQKFKQKVNGKKQSGNNTQKQKQNNVSTGTSQGKFSLKITDKDSHKARQLDIVLNTNPMHDDYHTGIRTVEDIYTADEVFNEDEFSGTPDWTIKNAQAALDKGKVTVYSSYPIKDGVFVTPSKMIAQDYAGDGRVYNKEVLLEDVAWITSEEGQLAQVRDSTRYSQQTDFYPYDGENAKSRGIRKTAVYDLADGLGSMFGIIGKIGKDGMRKEAFRIADKVEKFGYITKADMDNFFDASVNAARFTDEKADYAELKKRIRETGIEPVGGREYLDFLQKYKGKVKFKRGGMPIGTLYQDLAAQFPEYVDGSANNPQDMMWQLGEVYDNLQRKEMTVFEYYGDQTNEFIDDSYMQYAKKVDLFVEKINSISRYKQANVERKATKDRTKEQTARVYTLKDVEKARKNEETLKREITRLMADAPLTEDDKALLDYLQKIKSPDVLAATLKNMQDTNPNTKVIYKLYNLKQELEQTREPIREYARGNKTAKRAEFTDLLKTAKSWNEKHKFGGLRYKAETFERIIDDVVTDKKAAEKLKDMLPRSIHKHVAEGNRYKNELRERIRALNLDNKKLYDVEFENKNGQLIKCQLTESGLVQTFGEGLIDEDYLDAIGADVQKIIDSATEFRKIYNELIEKINEAYVRNGYKPVEYRRDYFPHFMEDGTDVLLNKLTSWFGIDAMSKIPASWQRNLAKITVKDYTNGGMLPTEIAGTTYKCSPGGKWNAHALQREGENTVYDALKGFDNYIETAADVIFLTDDIQNLRSFEDTIRYKFSDKGIQEEIDAIDEMEDLSPQEKWARKKEIYDDKNKNKYLNNFVSWLHNYTNLLAGKKSFSDREWEENLGRGIYQLSKDMESRVAANMVAGNISSALTNFIPIAQMTAQVKEKYIMTAMSDTVKNMMGKVDDGIVFQSDFLTNRFGSERLVDDSLAKKLENKPVIGHILAVMETVDEFTSNVVVRGRYMQNINDGMSPEAAMKDADEFAAALMADRSKGALPTIFETKNPVAKALTMFQVEQNNQLQYLLKDLPRSLGDKEELGKVLAMALLKYSLYSWLYNWMYEKIAGRKPAFSPIDLVTDVGKDAYRVAKGEMKASEAVSNAVVNVAEELPFAAAPLGVLGLSDDAGRLPISGALPDMANVLKLFDSEVSTEKKKQLLYKELSKPIYYLLFPVAGGQFKKTGEAMWQMAVNDGVSYSTANDGSKKVQFAVDTSNPLKWAQSAAFGRWSTEEAREYVNGGMKSLTKSESAMYEYLKGIGADNKKAYETAMGAKTEADTDGNGYLKTSEVVRYLDATGMSKQDKANLFAIMLPNVKNNPYA